MLSKTLVLTLAAVAAPGLALADNHRRHGDGHVEYARVVDAQPLYRTVTVRVPREACWDEVHYHEPEYRGRGRGRESAVLPTVAGGVVGGVIGRQFGDGSGRDAMTLFGTLVGAAIANDRVSSRNARRVEYHYDRGPRHVRTSTVTRCETRYETHEEERIDGYLVTYVYGGREFTTRTETHPGRRIPVDVRITPLG
jgi:uncharacterized protein YcfJ